jgi:hypothetical protein
MKKYLDICKVLLTCVTFMCCMLDMIFLVTALMMMILCGRAKCLALISKMQIDIFIAFIVFLFCFCVIFVVLIVLFAIMGIIAKYTMIKHPSIEKK